MKEKLKQNAKKHGTLATALTSILLFVGDKTKDVAWPKDEKYLTLIEFYKWQHTQDSIYQKRTVDFYDKMINILNNK